MKKILFTLFTITLLLTLSTSCQEDDPIVKDKRRLISATYHATYKTFTLTYSNGQTETVNAVIDNNTTPPTASATLDDGTEISFSDASSSGEASIVTAKDITNYQYVNSWIYDEMSIYYLWNDKITRTPDYTIKPDAFFESILYKYNSTSNPYGDRFSWIQDDYLELQDNLRGVVNDEIGFDYIFAGADKERTHYYALVTYSKHNTDAKAKGIDRGRFITQINGQNITASNYKQLFGGTGSKNLSIADWVYNSENKSYVLQSSDNVIINMHSKFAENPILMDSVYTYNDKKIGYLVYNFFARDRGNKSYEYDKQLMETLNRHKSHGVNEMVLDLRYNSGGEVSSAIALASALVKDRSTDNVLTISEYNTIVHNSLLRQLGTGYNQDHFINKIDTAKYDDNGKFIERIKITDVPSLNLPRLYVLTSDYTASASELVINGLKPYMDVILIGITTYGKNVGSITIFEEDDEDNKWGMQPIIVRISNSLGESDFTSGFNPDYEIDEFEDLFLYEFGDINDPLLGKAITLITGTTRSASTKRIATPFSSTQINKTISLDRRKNNHKFELYNESLGEDIRELMNN